MHASELAVGRWPGLLAHFGVDRSLLSGRHGPCPVCEGKDRFRFDDKEGRGTFYCSHCGAGDGFRLLSLIKGLSFKQVAAEIESVVGVIPAKSVRPSPSDADKIDACRRTWRKSSAVVAGDPVHSYLIRRTGIREIPGCIRFHAALAYRHSDGRVTRCPAMVARVTGPDGKGIALHRTYLTSEGEKAAVPTAKKVIGSMPASSAIQLFGAAPCLGIAEGIETALSASVMFGVPTWAAVTAGGMERWAPPAGTKRVLVFADNDLSGTGQASAWNLARRLISAGIETEVKIPPDAGTDWNDVEMLERGKERQF